MLTPDLSNTIQNWDESDGNYGAKGHVGSIDGSDYGAGIGPGLSAGFGRRSTQNSSQTSMPSNPSPADSHGSKRVSMGPEKIKAKGPKRVTKKKPMKIGTRAKAKRK